jgi:hypothetical protein
MGGLVQQPPSSRPDQQDSPAEAEKNFYAMLDVPAMAA